MLGDLLLKANRPHESAYQSYRGGEGGDLSMGHATCRADVVRARWSKWITVIIHMLHLAKAFRARCVPVYMEIWYVYRFSRAHYGEPPSRTGCSVVW